MKFVDFNTIFLLFLLTNFNSYFKRQYSRDFPGDPVVKTPRFHRRGREFDPWSGN